jgi:Nif-specific regulatory protein
MPKRTDTWPDIHPRYEVRELVGEGGMGSVYRAWDRAAERNVILKEYGLDTDDYRPRFIAEFRCLYELRHPCIPAAFDLFVRPERTFFTMEPVPGRTLGNIIREGLPADAGSFLSTLHELLSVLEYLERQHRAHRDIKPDNVLIQADAPTGPVVHLIDFGLSSLYGTDKDLDVEQQGTIHYTAPEVLRKEAFDNRSDLYALGVTLYEWMCGTNPFDDPNVVNVVVNHLEKPITDVPARWPFVDEPLKKIVLKLLEKKPDYRYQNVGEIRRDLERASPDGPTARGVDAYIHRRLFDREDIVRAVEEAYGVTQAAGLSLVNLIGDDGAGKSRLLETVRLEHQVAGRSVVSMTAQPNLAPLENLRTLLRYAYYEGPARTTDKHRPSVEWITGARSAPPAPGNTDWPSVLSEFAVEVLGGTVILLLDDFDALAPVERDFLVRIFRRFSLRSTGGCLVVVTSQSSLSASFPTLESSRYLIVDLFDRETTARFVGALLFAKDVPEDAAHRIFEATRGNAFLIEQAVLTAMAGGALTLERDEWRWSRDKQVPVPVSISDFLARKLSGLSAAERSMLSCAAVLPGEFTMEELRLAAPNVGRDRVRKWWREGLLTAADERWRLASQYLRETLLNELPAATLAEIHTRLADHYTRDRPDRTDLLAYHGYRSTQPERALRHLLALADQERAALLDLDAIVHYDQAAQILRGGNDPSALIDVLFSVEELWDRLGKRDRQKATVDEMLSLTADLPDKARRVDALLRLANYYERVSSYDEAIRTCEQAIEWSVRQAHGHGIGPLYRQAGKIEYSRGQLDDALRHFEQARRIAAEADDAQLLVEITNSLGTVYGSRGDFPSAIKAFEETARLAAEYGMHDHEVNAHLNLGLAHHKCLQYEAAATQYEKVKQSLKQSVNKKVEQKYFQYVGLLQLETQRYEAAYDTFQRLLEVSLENGDTASRTAAEVRLALILGRVGLFERGLPLLQKAVEAAAAHNPRYRAIYGIYLAEQFLDAKKYTQVKEVLADASRFFEEMPDSEWQVRTALVSILAGVRSSFLLVTETETDEKLGQLQQRLGATPDLQAALQVRMHFILSLAHWTRKRIDKAVLHSQQAVRMLDALQGYEYPKEQVYHHQYRVLSESGGTIAERRQALKKAYDIVSDVQSALKQSDFRTGYQSLPLTQDIQSAYEELFKEERESDIQSFQRLYEIAGHVNTLMTSDSLFERIMDAAIEHSRADRGLILLGSPSDEALEIRVARNMDQESLSDISNISKSIVEEVFRGGQPILTADANLDDRFRERKSIVAYQIRSIMCVPLRVRGDIIGAVYLDKRFDTHHFGPHQLRFLESFANLAGIAIENARLYEHVHGEKESLARENIDLKFAVQEKYIRHNIVGSSKAMRSVFNLIESAATNTAIVLIEGESGTGKELVARAIHYTGPRKGQKFVPVDCGAMPENLLESELFGYKKGAFTGATTDKKGLFEEADGGTIFLDEITNTSVNFQSRLLRVLQEGEIRRVGDNAVRLVDVRVITATNRNLAEMVRDGLFREDLFYRINVVPIQLPPLRERTEDIPLLVQYFCDKYSKQSGKPIESISADVMEVLAALPWKGNIRELENTVNRMVVFAQKPRLTWHDLPQELRSVKGVVPPAARPTVALKGRKNESLPQTLEELEDQLLAVEKAFFDQVLEAAEGNKSKAAEMLGIKRTTLNDRLKKLGLM